MIRPGHHRPLGTVAVMRFPDWPTQNRAPQLDDVVLYTGRGPGGDALLYRRAYTVVGVEETKTGYRLHLERIAWTAWPAGREEDQVWTFYDLPRSPR